MKSSLMCAAALAALAVVATPAVAQDERGPCLDQLCFQTTLLESADASVDGDATVAARFGSWGVDLSGRDLSVSPGDDFFRFANGTAVDRIEIPADRSNYGSSARLRELSQARLRALVEEYASASGLVPGSDEAKVAAYYRSFMDEARVEALDVAPLAADLKAAREARTRPQVAELMGRTMGGFGMSIFGAYVHDDAKQPDRNALYLFQGGLGLPDRDYYLTEQFAEQRAKYRDYVARMLRNVGWENAEVRASEILDFETRIAEASWTRAESRDDDKTYNPMTVAELEAAAPGFPWRAFFSGAGMRGADRAVVAQNTAFPKIAAVFADTPVETLQAWQAFHMTDQAAPYLSRRFADARFDFRNKTLSGQLEDQPRWKRGVTAVESALGEALGRVYVQRYFPPESKAMMDRLVADLITAMGRRIDRLEWMSPETKAKAHEKLSKFTVKIGYPDRWKDYSALIVVEGDLAGNVRRSAEFQWAEQVAKLGQPVDRGEWGMTPQTVNAYYSSTKNEIVFPAAILQPPFFDPLADPAVNYGAIGGVIGHEISHGFDDQGRKSDGDGFLREWWTPEDSAKFEDQARRLGAQYEAMAIIDGGKIDGQLTMGENIGDLGGLLLGLEAYAISLNGQEAPVLDGITGIQRVFYGWAQVWRVKYREQALRQLLVSDPHSPAVARVNGPIRNIDAWYDAFGVKEGDALYLKPEDRARIW